MTARTQLVVGRDKALKCWLAVHAAVVFVLPAIHVFQPPLEVALPQWVWIAALCSALLLTYSALLDIPKMGSVGAAVYSVVVGYVGILVKVPLVVLLYSAFAVLAAAVAATLWTVDERE